MLDRSHSNLALEVVSSLDAGLITSSGEKNANRDYLIDFNEILSRDDASEVISALPINSLYLSLKNTHDEVLLEVLPNISSEQFLRILDREVWDGQEINTSKICYWLKLLEHCDPALAFNQFKYLEEEIQLGFLCKHIVLITTEDLEKLPDSELQHFTALPCQTLHYALKALNPQDEEVIHRLIEAGLGEDLRYTYSMIEHAFYLPPNEAEFEAYRFHQARLEEDGYVSYLDSLKLFNEIDIKAFLASNKATTNAMDGLSSPGLVKRIAGQKDSSFFLNTLRWMEQNASSHDPQDGKLGQIKEQVLTLANTLCAATQIKLGDLEGMKHVLIHCQNFISIALEALSGGNMEQSAKVLTQNHVGTLFKFSYSLMHHFAKDILAVLAKVGFVSSGNLDKYFREQKLGLLQFALDQELSGKLDPRQVEQIKGVFNRFPYLVKPLPDDQFGETTQGSSKLILAPIDSLAHLKKMIDDLFYLTGQIYFAEILSVLPNLNDRAADLDTCLEAYMKHLALGISNKQISYQTVEGYFKNWGGELYLATKMHIHPLAEITHIDQSKYWQNICNSLLRNALEVINRDQPEKIMLKFLQDHPSAHQGFVL